VAVNDGKCFHGITEIVGVGVDVAAGCGGELARNQPLLIVIHRREPRFHE
jgi:hypothetical protein